MYNDEITFDKLPLAVTYLIEQVAELKQMVLKLQPTQSEKHVLIEIDDASRIIKRPSPPSIPLYAKGSSPITRKERNSTFTKMNYWHGLRMGKKRPPNRIMTKC